MDLKLLNRKIMIKPAQSKEKVGNIFLPDLVKKEKSNEGIIVKMAEDANAENLKIGDHVIFKDLGAKRIDLEGKTFVLTTKYSVIAKVEKD